ncbi:MAG: hypothetical protein WBL19_00755 [Minisyncoccia bacterium]
MTMSNERKGEIAILFLKERLRTGGIHLKDVKRQFSSEAKLVGIEPSEAKEFMELITRELVDEAFK